ncbi:hypothetical protein DICPUDRAFT_154059 [Dictyostelium purpureum]|uniref:Uncharacterized protein n=1 Tax=Dictyostelium purpureum TaxID=5786 RepID=F0ZQH0_DICPU|nr:uncharacterized protein DICPUDRAFT_154059 [Dictyostelium purpureum]EGC33792.1 hypothetical protein DICPUDRAFT_154059 [Dictyostelium purpureum]|eukprot:XP_003289663.1 hypothetical protein DICPUDRAFT_154059 [Dictyostelium purpureum]
MTKQALLIVDDYFTGFKLVNPKRALENTLRRILGKFREMHQMVFIKQITFPGIPYFIEGTPGCELHDKLVPRLSHYVFVIKKSIRVSLAELREPV